MRQIFQVGNPIPKAWLHMEFDFADTQKYLGGAVISDKQELKRLTDKYING